MLLMKKFCLFLSMLLISIIFLSFFGAVYAQSKPSIPEFTVKLVDNSYNTPPTQTTNPYTGPTTIPGNHIEKIEVEITIKNQNYPSNIMYNVRTKGHYEKEWTKEVYGSPFDYPEQSKGQYTVITLPAGHYIDGSQVDIQVEAMSGTISWEFDGASLQFRGDGNRYFFDGVTSGWSKTQTLTINKNINKITNEQPGNPETSPGSNQQINFSLIELVVITTVAVIIGVTATLLVLRRGLNAKTFNHMK
jgi:hypothetical protein